MLRKKRAESIWDSWLGNINLFVVKPKEQSQVKIIAGNDINDTVNEFLASAKGLHASMRVIFLQQNPPNGPPVSVRSFVIIAAPGWTNGGGYMGGSMWDGRGYFSEKGWLEPLTEPYIKILDSFIKEFYPEVTDHNYPPKDISIEDWNNWAPGAKSLEETIEAYREKNKDGSGSQTLISESFVKGFSIEQWKGEYIVSANTLQSPEEATLESMLKTCPLKFKKPEFVKRFFPNTKVPKLTEAACEVLLEFNNQLQFGLDFEHLPAGFEIKQFIENGKQVSALDYSKTKARLGTKDQSLNKCMNHCLSPMQELK